MRDARSSLGVIEPFDSALLYLFQGHYIFMHFSSRFGTDFTENKWKIDQKAYRECPNLQIYSALSFQSSNFHLKVVPSTSFYINLSDLSHKPP